MLKRTTECLTWPACCGVPVGSLSPSLSMIYWIQTIGYRVISWLYQVYWLSISSKVWCSAGRGRGVSLQSSTPDFSVLQANILAFPVMWATSASARLAKSAQILDHNSGRTWLGFWLILALQTAILPGPLAFTCPEFGQNQSGLRRQVSPTLCESNKFAKPPQWNVKYIMK